MHRADFLFLSRVEGEGENILFGRARCHVLVGDDRVRADDKSQDGDKTDE